VIDRPVLDALCDNITSHHKHGLQLALSVEPTLYRCPKGCPLVYVYAPPGGPLVLYPPGRERETPQAIMERFVCPHEWYANCPMTPQGSCGSDCENYQWYIHSLDTPGEPHAYPAVGFDSVRLYCRHYPHISIDVDRMKRDTNAGTRVVQAPKPGPGQSLAELGW